MGNIFSSAGSVTVKVGKVFSVSASGKLAYGTKWAVIYTAASAFYAVCYIMIFIGGVSALIMSVCCGVAIIVVALGIYHYFCNKCGNEKPSPPGSSVGGWEEKPLSSLPITIQNKIKQELALTQKITEPVMLYA